MKPFSEINVISLGDLVADLNIRIPGLPVESDRHQVVQSVQLEPGGAGNFLLAGARLGLRMTALGVVGADLYGQQMLEILQSEGIDVRQVICQTEGNTTLVFVLADGTGQHVFLGHYGNGPQVSLTEEWKTAIRAADAIQSFGYTLNESRLTTTMLASMQYARSQGKPVFFDPGPHVIGVDFHLVSEALACCTGLLLTEDEIPLVLPGASGLEAAPRLLTDTTRLVVVKRGPAGCILFTPDERVEHPGFAVQMRDTTAAGDSFAAALIGAHLQGRPLREVAAIANAMGAAKVQKPGSGRQVPTLAEIRQILVDFSEVIKI
ncbi:MAG: carbohydrate kinase family protein [Chloroflexi bacterium]|nr:carbohydrate kinase family protein [Chloroflexota bacterium]